MRTVGPARSTRISRAACVAITLAMLTGASALGQDHTSGPDGARQGDAQAEIARLRARVAELEAALASASAALAEAQRAIDAALGRGGAPARGAPSDALPATPLAGPDALFAALQRDYRRAFAEPGPIDQRRVDVGRWCQRIATEMRGRVEWLVALDELVLPTEPTGSPAPRAPTVRVQVLDAGTLAPVGLPFVAELPERLVPLVVRSTARGAVWRADVDFAAAPAHNPTRASAGAFDHPRFIGPFAEFGFALTWRSLTPSGREREVREPTEPSAPATPGGVRPPR